MLPATNPSDRTGLNLILRQAVNILNSIEALQSTAVKDGTLEFVNELHLRAVELRLDVNSKLGKKSTIAIADTTIHPAVNLWITDRSTDTLVSGMLLKCVQCPKLLLNVSGGSVVQPELVKMEHKKSCQREPHVHSSRKF
jgi:hypothetical protein